MNKRNRIVNILKEKPIDQSILINGWVRTKRDSKGNFSFIEVNDGSCIANLQVIADQTLPNYENEIKKLSTGCSVGIRIDIGMCFWKYFQLFDTSLTSSVFEWSRAKSDGSLCSANLVRAPRSRN